MLIGLIIVFLGLLAGLVLKYSAIEEISSCKKYISFTLGLIFSIIIFLVFFPYIGFYSLLISITVFIISLFVDITSKYFYSAIAALTSLSFIHFNYFALIISLGFLYSMLVASLDECKTFKKSIIALSSKYYLFLVNVILFYVLFYFLLKL